MKDKGILKFNRARFLTLLILLAAALLSLPGTLWAGLYAYLDENGVYHFTNAPTDSRYRLIQRSTFSPILSSGLGKYDSEIQSISQQYHVDPALVRSIIRVESGFNPMAISVKGAQGLMQLMPGTAQGLKVSNPFNPRENIRGGVLYLRYLLDLFAGDLVLALAAYNAGENAVLRYQTVPPYPETQAYVRKVLSFYDPSLESQVNSLSPGGPKVRKEGGPNNTPNSGYQSKIYKQYRYLNGEKIVIYTNIPASYRPGVD